jgi:type II secretory pathway pseudopilin PulG
MKRHITYSIVIIFLIALLVISYSRQQDRVKKVLAQNERLLNENRHLQESLEINSNTTAQIQSRREVQERVEEANQGTFVERRTYFRKNWHQFITINTNDYKTGFLGGVKDLKLIVRNQTEYPLDNVVVSVQYLKGNGDVFKTEQYTVNNVPAKGTQSVSAAASRKGQKVEIKLVSITSQPMNFCWAANKPAAAGDPDPYQCTPAANQ